MLPIPKINNILITSIYKSYFSNETKTPLFVEYRLYKGGGDSSRKGLVFEKAGLRQSASEKDYRDSGYDIGHMCNAEDFAFDPVKEKETFRFYNALPQTEKLNRGCWKKLETKVRKQSQNEELLIICGGFDFNKKMHTVSVPDFCFKIIKDSKNIITSYIAANNNSDILTQIDNNELLEKLCFNDDIKKSLGLPYNDNNIYKESFIKATLKRLFF
jgi:endonuclease G